MADVIEANSAMDTLPGLHNTMGPAFTFGKHAMKALMTAVPDTGAWSRVLKAMDGATDWADAQPSWNYIKRMAAGKIDWDKVEKKTIVESIEAHGQDPDDVVAAIRKFSPNCQSDDKRDVIGKIVEGMAPELSKRYDEVRAKLDAEYQSEKAANNGIIKFVTGGPSPK